MANVDKVRENEDQLSILNAVARHASALATFDPENGEYKTFQARLYGDFIKQEPENLSTKDLEMHPEIFTTLEAPSHSSQETMLKTTFTRLNGSKTTLQELPLFWKSTLLTQPPTTDVSIKYSITRTIFVIRRSILPLSFSIITSGATHIHNPDGIHVNNLRTALLHYLESEGRYSLLETSTITLNDIYCNKSHKDRGSVEPDQFEGPVLGPGEWERRKKDGSISIMLTLEVGRRSAEPEDDDRKAKQEAEDDWIVQKAEADKRHKEHVARVQERLLIPPT
ncbi:uncharacterized protein BKA78DRAFT_357946 [Phyllosticta capitalensis]|uniref:Uncharacterized protein n=1 Tax=Phyllosticta capitalensis TaxID=121624 RepID=A0ABR1Y8T1_9PEZI